MEFRTPRLTDVLSTPVPIQLLQSIPFLVNTSSILLNMVSAVHLYSNYVIVFFIPDMSRSCVSTSPRLLLKNLTVRRFIFSKPLS